MPGAAKLARARCRVCAIFSRRSSSRSSMGRVASRSAVAWKETASQHNSLSTEQVVNLLPECEPFDGESGSPPAQYKLPAADDPKKNKLKKKDKLKLKTLRVKFLAFKLRKESLQKGLIDIESGGIGSRRRRLQREEVDVPSPRSRE
eukprot:scaffold26_cov159-Ochromonas_danica.AAC.11